MLRVALAVLSASAALALGCAGAASTDESSGSAEGALESLPRGITEASLEAEGGRIVANARAVTAHELVTKALLPEAAAQAIVDYRVDTNGVPRWFRTLGEVLALPAVGEDDVRSLLHYAIEQGYVERRGFDEPNQARLAMERATPRPKESDITLERGFDGLAPDEVVSLVRGRLTNTVHAQNEAFVLRTIRENHKAFTLGAWNILSPGSPPAEFARRLGAERLTLLGTMSAVHRTILVAERGERAAYYARGERGDYEPLPAPPRYPIIMRARLRQSPAGVRVFYPEWYAPVLSGPTSVVEELGTGPAPLPAPNPTP